MDLAINCPIGTMIVWTALLSALVYMGEDAEAELRVFIEDLALRNVVAKVSGDELLVFQHILQ